MRCALSAVLLLIFALPMGSRAARGQSPEVQALYAEARAAQQRNRTAEAIADYRKILKLSPQLGPAYNNLGRLLFNEGRYSEAVKVLKQGLAVAPEMAPAQVMLGASYLHLGELQQALMPLEAGIKAMPEDRFARLSLARVEMGLEHPQKALTQLDALLAAAPKDQEAWYLAGKLHLQLSQEAFTRVQALDPNSALAHQMEGEVMESMQNTPGAVAAYKQAIAAAPADPAPLQHLAELYWQTGDWAHARERYAALLAMEPGNCIAHWHLANALDELAQPVEEGLKQVDEALRQCPSLAQARAERARLLLRLGRPSEALPELLAAEKAAPDEPAVQQMLAQAYRATGDRPRAEAAQQRFIAIQQAIHQAKESHAAAVIEANH